MRKALILGLLPVLVSCQTASSSVIEGQIFEEEIKRQVIDDKYRNYYEIFVSSFADSDQDGIGDLNGITSKISYLSELGFTGLYLTPIFESNSYHKYDVNDYFAIDEDFGTIDDLKTLINTAHESEMKVILDLPLNHTGYYNKWFEKSLLAHQKEINGLEMTDEEKKYSDLYVFYDTLEEAKQSGKTYYRAGANPFYYEANFSSDMPELNYDNPLTYDLVETVFKYYLDLGVDGFRLDAAKYYYLNDTSRNIEVLNNFKKYCQTIKDTYIVAEVWDSQSIIKEYSKSEIDSFFYFPMSSAYPSSFITNSFGFEGMHRDKYLNGQLEMLSCDTKIAAPFLDNHDMNRLTQSGDIRRTKMQLGLLAMCNGSSFTYYGDEIGMSSSNNPGGDYADSNYRTHYYWGDENIECHDPSYSNRQTNYFGTAKEQSEDPNSILNYQKKANLLRNAYKSIARGEISVTEEDEKVNDNDDVYLLAYDKTYEDEKVKLVFNFSMNQTLSYKTDLKVSHVLLSDVNKKATYLNGELELPPYSIALLEY